MQFQSTHHFGGHTSILKAKRILKAMPLSSRTEGKDIRGHTLASRPNSYRRPCLHPQGQEDIRGHVSIIETKGQQVLYPRDQEDNNSCLHSQAWRISEVVPSFSRTRGSNVSILTQGQERSDAINKSSRPKDIEGHASILKARKISEAISPFSSPRGHQWPQGKE